MSEVDSSVKIRRNSDLSYEKLLISIADNLMSVIPSQFKRDDIRELEKILNELYTTSYLEVWPLEIQKALLNALGRASELNFIMQQIGNKNISHKFFRRIKQFGPILYMMAVHLEKLNK